MEHFVSTRLKRMMTWIDDNPHVVYTSSYDEQITDAEANMLLAGQFDQFNESIWEQSVQYDEYDPHMWDSWQDDFVSEFGFEGWDSVPDRIKTICYENRHIDMSEWVKDAIKHKKPRVTATVHKHPRKDAENYIFAPSNWTDRDDKMDEEDKARARYLMTAFGVTFDTVRGYAKTEQLRDQLEVIYGGYDREQLTVIGTVDLWEVYDKQQAPTHITMGPEDVDNILFYEHFNGCGNMGALKLTRTRVMPATLIVDGTLGHGVDSCYGFVGEVWRHPIRIAPQPKGGAA